jgi:phage terminase small subunit
MPPLDNPKRDRFCREYIIDNNGLQAALRAGYSARTAKVQASQLLTVLNVQERIAELRGAVNEKLDITAERVLREAARLAFSDPRKFFNADGSLKPITELDDDTAAAMASFESVEKAIAGGEGETETIRKVKFWDKPSSIGMLGKHLNLFVEKLDVAEGLAAILDRARNRRPPKRA